METIVTADDRGRVILRGVRRGDRFRVRDDGDRKVLEKLKPEKDPPLVKPVRRGGRLMLPMKWTPEQVRAAVRSGRERS